MHACADAARAGCWERNRRVQTERKRLDTAGSFWPSPLHLTVTGEVIANPPSLSPTLLPVGDGEQVSSPRDAWEMLCWAPGCRKIGCLSVSGRTVPLPPAVFSARAFSLLSGRAALRGDCEDQGVQARLPLKQSSSQPGKARCSQLCSPHSSTAAILCSVGLTGEAPAAKVHAVSAGRGSSLGQRGSRRRGWLAGS